MSDKSSKITPDQILDKTSGIAIQVGIISMFELHLTQKERDSTVPRKLKLSISNQCEIWSTTSLLERSSFFPRLSPVHRSVHIYNCGYLSSCSFSIISYVNLHMRQTMELIISNTTYTRHFFCLHRHRFYLLRHSVNILSNLPTIDLYVVLFLKFELNIFAARAVITIPSLSLATDHFPILTSANALKFLHLG